MESNLSLENLSRRGFLGALGLMTTGFFRDEYAYAEERDSLKFKEAFKERIIIDSNFDLGVFLCSDVRNENLTNKYCLDNFKDINKNARLVSEDGNITYLDYPTYKRDDKLFVVIYNPERKNHKLEFNIVKREESELNKEETKEIKDQIRRDYRDILEEYPYLNEIMDRERFNESESRMINRIVRHEFPTGSIFWGIGKSGRIVEYKWEDKIFESKQFELGGNHRVLSLGKKYFKPGVYGLSLNVIDNEIINANAGSIPFIIFD